MTMRCPCRAAAWVEWIINSLTDGLKILKSLSLLSMSAGRTRAHGTSPFHHHHHHSHQLGPAEHILNQNEVTAHNILPIKPLLAFGPLRDKETKQPAAIKVISLQSPGQ